MDPITRQVALASAGAGGETVDDVFSVDLYTGTGQAQTITNDINLAGAGGLVWIKNRDAAGSDHVLQDTARGTSSWVQSNSSVTPASRTDLITSFNSDGFSIGSFVSVSSNNDNFVSWVFRRAGKFFDVVTWTGDGTGVRLIPHNLGVVPGMILIKRLGVNTGAWYVYHSGIGNLKHLILNSSNGQNIGNSTLWNQTDPTSTHFTVNSNDLNQIDSYVAFVFADDEDFIKCGSYTGPGNTVSISLNFTPQFLMVKQTNSTGDWIVLDTTRGWQQGINNDKPLEWNTTDAELTYVNDVSNPITNGFQIVNGLVGLNTSGDDFIYMAIAAP